MGRSLLFVIGALEIGCSFTHGRVLGDGGNSDAACEPTGYVDRCAVPPPQGPLRLAADYVYDTDAGTLLDSIGTPIAHVTSVQTDRDPDLRIISVTELIIDAGASLYAHGSLPLAIVSTGSIDISGTLDLGARLGMPGAGGFASCVDGAGRGLDDLGGASGGGGGGFGAAGGSGGHSDANGGVSFGGAAGPSIALPADLRGGCPGGGGGTGVEPGGSGGAAGGGILVLADVKLSVSGVVRAGGGGGGTGLYLNAGDGDGGGGGGGAGGMIVLDAPTIEIDGFIAANGGGGGGGAADTGAGMPGSNALDLIAATPGGPGRGTTSADGGFGGYASAPAGTMPTELFNGGGGGGGGGVGFIVIRSGNLVATNGKITPIPQ